MSSKSSKVKANARGVRRRELAGNRQRHALGQGSPRRLQFGEHGELTPRTIKQAGLTKAEEKRAYEMMEVQAAFLSILDTMSFPVGPDGTTHDLGALGPTRDAIAWTLALNGFRQTGQPYIKKRAVPGALYKDAHTWVDVRAPDDARDELRPEDKADDQSLPPDTRRLAAQRDGVQPLKMPDGFKAGKPKVVWINEPRPEGRDD